MAIIKSQIDTTSKEFAANDSHMRDLVADLQKHLDQVELGGGEKHVKSTPVAERCYRVNVLIN